MRSRSFQGVLDGESAEFFFSSRLRVESRATPVLTFTFHTSIISTDRVMKGGSTAEETEILRSTFELVVKEGEKQMKRICQTVGRADFKDFKRPKGFSSQIISV